MCTQRAKTHKTPKQSPHTIIHSSKAQTQQKSTQSGQTQYSTQANPRHIENLHKQTSDTGGTCTSKHQAQEIYIEPQCRHSIGCTHRGQNHTKTQMNRAQTQNTRATQHRHNRNLHTDCPNTDFYTNKSQTHRESTQPRPRHNRTCTNKPQIHKELAQASTRHNKSTLGPGTAEIYIQSALAQNPTQTNPRHIRSLHKQDPT